MSVIIVNHKNIGQNRVNAFPKSVFLTIYLPYPNYLYSSNLYILLPEGGYKKMKKILVIIGICIILGAMPITVASPLLKSTHVNSVLREERPMLTNGSFTGEFAEKNENGTIPLGIISGTYAGEHMGTFTGIWSLYDGNASGTINGWFLGALFLGQLNTTGVEGSDWFIGLYRVNTTDNSFEAGAIVSANDGYAIRYAIGTI